MQGLGEAARRYFQAVFFFFDEPNRILSSRLLEVYPVDSCLWRGLK